MTEGMVNISALMRGPQSSPDSLKKIAMLAERLKEGEKQIELLKEKLAAYEGRYKEISTIELPDAMQEAGVREFTLHNGEKIEIKSIVAASIPSAYEEQAFKWLEDNEHGDLIKNEISVTFGRSENENAMVIFEELNARGFNASRSKKVHPQTLSAFVREQLADAKAVPMEILGVYMGKKAVIKQAKPTKKEKKKNVES